MCFVLYVGTAKPLPRKKWQPELHDLCIESLSEHDIPIREHFTKPEVQYIGSTSGCGCDFPHAMFQRGEWPIFEKDADQEASNRHNQEALIKLLRSTGEETVELYGMWEDGDYLKKPKIREEITVQKLLDRDFRFKEQGFYVVRLET